MRTSFFSSLSSLVLLVLSPALASAHADSGSNAVVHKRVGMSHKRVVNSRHSRRSSTCSVHNSTTTKNATTTGSSLGITNATTTTNGTTSSGAAGSCFPSAGFKMPSEAPSSLDGWWCNPDTEYAFLGFSYEISACQSLTQLNKEFKDIKETFGGRYVRLYGACDKKGYYDDVVEAAWTNGLGVHSLIWFGFTGGNQWETRRDDLFATFKSNPKAKFVTRMLQFGSEPLFDQVLTPAKLTAQVVAAKKELQPYGINVTVSDMVYGFTSNGGAQDVLDAMDNVNAHILEFFSTKATTGSESWPLVTADLEWFMKHAPGKKIYMDENGWPSTTYSGVEANSKKAVADVSSEQQYFDLLDSKCSYFKETNGGIGWFFHIYSDDQEPGYGLYSTSGKLKFPFKPKTSC